jgi:hypothetical protein
LGQQRVAIAPLINTSIQEDLAFALLINTSLQRASARCGDHGNCFSTVSAVFHFLLLFRTRTLSEFKKKLLLHLKEFFFDHLTPIRPLSILHSQFSAFAQQ